MKTIKITKPGKLYLMGEYAVVAGYHALIVPTTWKITVTIKPSNSFTIESNQWQKPIYFDFQGDELQTTESSLWTKPVETVHRLASELNIEIKPYHIKIDSELDQSIDHKWGLGSSGALTVALIDAITNYMNYPLTAIEQYKLSVISQIDDIFLTSFGDLACSSFEEPILYRMPSFEMLNLIKNQPLLKSLETPWQQLIIKPVIEKPLPLLVIHSNMKADSHTLVKNVFKAKEKIEFKQLMAEMDKLVLKSYQAWISHDMQSYKDAMHGYHHKLLQLEIISQTTLLTEPLKYLSDLALQYQIVHKFSGAGGGDNMLYFIDEASQKYFIEKVLSNTYPILNEYMKGIQK
jgi:phosphomevalonate kinase